MKLYLITIAGILTTTAVAQLPVPWELATAASGEAIGTTDLHWQMSASPTGPFEPARVIGNCEGHWFAPTIAANWITYDQGNGCNHNIDLDLYFQRTVYLPATNSCGRPVEDVLCFEMGFHADNCIQSVNINGVSNYTYTGSANNCDNLGTPVIIQLCLGWQAGENLLTVHVKSTPIAVGFMAFAPSQPFIPLSFLGPDTFLCSATSYLLPSPDSLTRWFDGSTGQTKTIEQPGLYWAARLDAEGCEFRDSINVVFNAPFYMPNSFSPNGDGVNDEFLPNFAEQPSAAYLLKVFDRWGNLVFTSHEPDKGWNGDSRGKPCGPGIYTYLIQFGGQACPVQRSGNVLLLH